MDEAVNIKLTAQDVASSVLKHVAGNVDVVKAKLQTLTVAAKETSKTFQIVGQEIYGFMNDGTPVMGPAVKAVEAVDDKIKDTEVSAKKGAKALGDFASVLGAGEIGRAATEIVNFKESIGDAAAMLKGGGVSALAMKAGLVGLTAVASYKIGEVIAGWAFETKRFSKELGEAAAKAKELGDIQSMQSGRRIDQDIADLKEFGGTFQQQMGKAKELAAQIGKELAGKGGQEELAKAQLEKLESQRSYYLASQEEVDAAKANLEVIQQQKKVLQEKLSTVQQEFSEAELERVRKREAQAQEKTREQERLNYILEGEEKRKQVAEDRAKFEQQQIEKEQKLREQMLKKQQAAEIKAAGDSVKALESEISDLEKLKIDTSRPTLNSQDERMTSLARGSGDIAKQQLDLTKRQVKLSELNQKLMQENSRYLKLLAEKEESVIAFGGAG